MEQCATSASAFHILWVVSTATAGVFLMSFPVRMALVRWNIIDRPNHRSSHTRPTARGGGIAIMLVILLEGMALGWRSEMALVLMGLSLGLAALSFWYDLAPLPSSIRFGGHVLVALGFLQVLGWPQITIDLTGQPTVTLPVFLNGLVLFLWLAGYTNAFNFMDGINGIAAGQAIITGIGMAVLSLLATLPHPATSIGAEPLPASANCLPELLGFCLAGAALGFLPHNFPRARMFMGDVGSAPLGFLLAVLALWLARDHGWWLLPPLVLLHANFILDTAITLGRRVLRGEKWHEAHREHFYRRLVRSGKSHSFVTGWEMALQVVVLGLMVVYLRSSTPVRMGLIGFVLLIWLAFFAYCERSFRRMKLAI